MILRNLIDIADYDLTMMLSKMDSRGNQIGYDFKNNCWLENNLFSEDRLIPIGKFAKCGIYRQLMEYHIAGWSHIKVNTVEALKNVSTKKGVAVHIKVISRKSLQRMEENVAERVDTIHKVQRLVRKNVEPKHMGYGSKDKRKTV